MAAEAENDLVIEPAASSQIQLLLLSSYVVLRHGEDTRRLQALLTREKAVRNFERQRKLGLESSQARFLRAFEIEALSMPDLERLGFELE